jgi:hypothetical protein
MVPGANVATGSRWRSKAAARPRRYAMRCRPTDEFWVVVDPKPDCAMEDILFQTSLKDLGLQFKGGVNYPH